MDENCELTELMLLDTNPQDGSKQGITLEYVIAVQKAPKALLPIFNPALKELKANGKLDELKRRYWNRKCNGSPSDKAHYIISSMCALFSLSISLFLLS